MFAKLTSFARNLSHSRLDNNGNEGSETASTPKEEQEGKKLVSAEPNVLATGTMDEREEKGAMEKREAEQKAKNEAVSLGYHPGIGSKGSFSTSTSINAKHPYAREISETFSSKAMKCKWVFVSFVVNSVLLWFVAELGKGMRLPLSVNILSTVGTVLLEIVLLVANIITFFALDDGAASFFGKRLTSRRGYSLAVCGFQHSSAFGKWSYCNELSLNSPCRKLLERIAIIWFVLEFLKLLTPLGATSIDGSILRVDRGAVSCVEFTQEGEPVDRKWPTIQTEIGFAELVFGTSLGLLRSEIAGLNATTFVMTPNIIGAVQDGDTIAGNGYTVDIVSTCKCTTGLTRQGVQAAASDLPDAAADALLAAYGTLTEFGLANHVYRTPEDVRIASMMYKSPVCGGTDFSFTTVCTTVFNNHKTSKMLVEYMTDGTPASIAPKTSTIREITGNGNLTWIYTALVNILDGQTSSFPLPNTIPGVMNPLLWWTTPNLLTIDPNYLEGGIETTFSILLRAGIQRTFSTKGASCTQNIAIPGECLVVMAPYGVQISAFLLGFDLLVTFVALLAFLPTILGNDPAEPGIRVVKENVYLMTLLRCTNMDFGFHELGSAPTHALWQALDIVVRVGENLQTLTEDVGHITLDKPKVVKTLVNARRYY